MTFDVHLYVHDTSAGKLDLILQQLRLVLVQGVKLMATVKELSDELDAIKTAVDTVKALVATQVTQIADLTAQLAAGTPVSQAQLDDLDAKADGILAALTPAP